MGKQNIPNYVSPKIAVVKDEYIKSAKFGKVNSLVAGKI